MPPFPMRSGQLHKHSANTPSQYLPRALYSSKVRSTRKRAMLYKRHHPGAIQNPMCATGCSEPQARTVAEYLAPLNSPVVEAPNECGTVMSHRDSIELIRKLGTKFVPELKRPEVPMPFRGFSQQDYADKMLAEYRQAASPSRSGQPAILQH
ncbi:MAG: hypothetical protein CM15mP120_16010 [Pseudomonadota bacterium]|nr:MAG: hypothetical protein CM15mP120_16010 [Pseudomonadota bacterium]